MSLVIDNPDRELMFLLQCKHRLPLEMKGIRFKGLSATTLVNRRYNKQFRRKAHALEFVTERLAEYEEMGPKHE
jgi:hypothetical protein